MATAVFVQDGECIDYTPAADVDAGDVVLQGDLLGIAKLDIPDGSLGAIAVTGVFDIAKVAATAITAGAIAYWDNTNKVATNTSNSGANKQLGKFIREAAAADATARVRLSQ